MVNASIKKSFPYPKASARKEPLAGSLFSRTLHRPRSKPRGARFCSRSRSERDYKIGIRTESTGRKCISRGEAGLLPKALKSYFPLLLLLGLLGFLLFPPAPLHAKGKSGWQTKNNIDYYYSQEGVPLTGLQRIQGKTYYFQENGKQYHGWKKLGESYYYFGQGRKTKGCMVTQSRPNDFALDSSGAALLPTEGEAERMQALSFVSELMTLRCKSTWGKKKKLKSMYNYALLLPYLYDDTDKTAAQCVLKFSRWIDGDCADTNSFMAFAGCLLGMESYVVNDYGHWWAQIDGLIYDTNYENFAAPLQEARQKGFDYQAAQFVPAGSSQAGSVMMTIHPERYGYVTPTPSPEEEEVPESSLEDFYAGTEDVETIVLMS